MCKTFTRTAQKNSQDLYRYVYVHTRTLGRNLQDLYTRTLSRNWQNLHARSLSSLIHMISASCTRRWKTCSFLGVPGVFCRSWSDFSNLPSSRLFSPRLSCSQHVSPCLSSPHLNPSTLRGSFPILNFSILFYTFLTSQLCSTFANSQIF